MTGLATSSAPTLLGKLRALQERLNEDHAGDWSHDDDVAYELALSDYVYLLPEIVAALERDEQDAARLDSRAIRIDNPKHNPPFSVLHRNIDLRAAIDAAQERT